MNPDTESRRKEIGLAKHRVELAKAALEREERIMDLLALLETSSETVVKAEACSRSALVRREVLVSLLKDEARWNAQEARRQVAEAHRADPPVSVVPASKVAATP